MLCCELSTIQVCLLKRSVEPDGEHFLQLSPAPLPTEANGHEQHTTAEAAPLLPASAKQQVLPTEWIVQYIVWGWLMYITAIQASRAQHKFNAFFLGNKYAGGHCELSCAIHVDACLPCRPVDPDSEEERQVQDRRRRYRRRQSSSSEDSVVSSIRPKRERKGRQKQRSAKVQPQSPASSQASGRLPGSCDALTNAACPWFYRCVTGWSCSVTAAMVKAA